VKHLHWPVLETTAIVLSRLADPPCTRLDACLACLVTAPAEEDDAPGPAGGQVMAAWVMTAAVLLWYQPEFALLARRPGWL